MAAITFTFPAQTINDDGDDIQLIIIVNNTYGTTGSYNAHDQLMRVTKWGELKIEYDMEKALTLPSIASMEISDSANAIVQFLFGASAVALTVDKQLEVKILFNSSLVFWGHMIEDTISFDQGTKLLSFEAAPKTDIINKQMVYDEDGGSINPFSYTDNNTRNIPYLLEDIFKLVNSSISYSGGDILFNSGFRFRGQRTAASGGEVWIDEMTLEDLYQNVHRLFFDNTMGISTLGDLVKKFALDWCSMIGMISYDKAFMKQLFRYDTSNVQTVVVLNQRMGYRYGLIDYVKINTKFADEDPNDPYEQGTFTELIDRFIVRDLLPGFYITSTLRGSNIDAVPSFTNQYVFDHGSTMLNPPSLGAVYSNNGSQFTVLGRTPDPTNWPSQRIATQRTSGTNEPSASGTLTKVSGTGDTTYTYSSYDQLPGNHVVWQAKHESLYSAAYKNWGDLVAKFWYTYRGDIQSCRVDWFLLAGVGYDFLKDFTYGSSRFQPISMTKKWAHNITEVEAIYMGETTE